MFVFAGKAHPRDEPGQQLIKQLADIREGNRDNPTMYPFALPRAIGGAQALADVVAYMEKLPMNPENGKGDWAEGTPGRSTGASRDYYNSAGKLPWNNFMGDWRDANDVSQGNSAYAATNTNGTTSSSARAFSTILEKTLRAP